MSKLAKFRRNPELFFTESKKRWVRAAGRLAGPVLRSSSVRELAIDPVGTITTLPGLGGIAARLQARAREHRAAAIERAGSPTVSVIMAAHDAADTIEVAIRSVLEQSYPRLELVIVDDASSDDTSRVAESFADPRVTVVRSEVNRGAARTRNHGLSLATGELATFHDADDRSHPERLERQVAALCDRQRAVVCVCSSQREDESRRPVLVNGRQVAKAVITMMFRREPVLERIGFFRDLPVSEDAEYYERIKASFGAASEVVLIDRLYYQLFRPDSLLFSDGAVALGGARSVQHQRSETAEATWQGLLAQLERIRSGDESPYVARID